ncbi:tail protein X [Terasakiella sp.]|uniref:tail protein X n=1 Tax=Terasakiella sp. TaxID=2034861 RepID=UPI003AA9B273
MQTYRTSQGDTVDYIAWKYYGTEGNRHTELILEANPGLSGAGPVLPAGVTVILPDAPAPAVSEGVRLWD